jgi:hypothetical protein
MKSPDVAFYFSRREHRAGRAWNEAINPFYRRDNLLEARLALSSSSRGPPCTRGMYRVHRVAIKYIYTRIGDADSAVSICRSHGTEMRTAGGLVTGANGRGGSNYLLRQMNPSSELFDGDLSDRYLNRMCKVGRNPGEQPASENYNFIVHLPAELSRSTFWKR